MTTTAIPMPAGAVPADDGGAAAGSSAPQQPTPNADGAVPMPANAVSADAPAPSENVNPEPVPMVSQGRDRFGNEVRIPKTDTPGSLVGPLAIPVGAAAIGAGASTLPEMGALLGAGGKALIPALEKGGQAVVEWAEAHPTAAKVILEGIKGAGWYKLLQTAMRK